MLYEPIKFETKGLGKRSNFYGLGVLTEYGAYITGMIPSLERVYVTSYTPRYTTFNRLSGKQEVFITPPGITTGVQTFNIIPRKRVRHSFSIDPARLPSTTLNLKESKKGNFDVLIEEKLNSTFRIYIQEIGTNASFQPFNDWVWKKVQ
jgi:hypothetical protein